MKTILATFLILLILIPVSTFGEIQTITHSVKQPFGGSQSPDDARIAAVAKAKREALEMAGVYVEALTIVKNARVEKDEILALTAGVLKAEVISQKNYLSGDAFGIEIVVNVQVDSSIMEERVRKMLQDKMHIGQLKQAQAREKELLDKVAELEKENRELSRKGQSNEKLKEQFHQASQGLTFFDRFFKAANLLVGGEYTDPKKAIEHLNEAIRLKPDNADAYNLRGIAYSNLGQHQRAIEDFNQAIRLDPNHYEAYYNRGIAYHDIGLHQRAVEDYNQAIRLRLDYVDAYNNRGIAYRRLGQHQRAIEDYNEAIRLKPDFVTAYNNRGLAYDELGQHQRAIEDYNEAIRLKPDFVTAYNNRGIAYFISGNTTEGCRSVLRACELGNCDVYEIAKKNGDCR